jgi:hypothetical protein
LKLCYVPGLLTCLKDLSHLTELHLSIISLSDIARTEEERQVILPSIRDLSLTIHCGGLDAQVASQIMDVFPSITNSTVMTDLYAYYPNADFADVELLDAYHATKESLMKWFRMRGVQVKWFDLRSPRLGE